MICLSGGSGRTIAERTEYLVAMAKASNKGLRDRFDQITTTILVDGKTTARLVNGRWRRLYRTTKRA